jgi:hypothetical protein
MLNFFKKLGVLLYAVYVHPVFFCGGVYCKGELL